MRRNLLLGILMAASCANLFAQATASDSTDRLTKLVTKAAKRPSQAIAKTLLHAYLVEADVPGALDAANANATRLSLAAAVNDLRTDVQTGTSSAVGSTTLTEKPGYADILSIALERGAITQSTNDGSLTLSTTPYAFWVGFGATDSPANWNNHPALRRISIASTFGSSTITKDSDFESFQSGELKFVAFGNRSPRDGNFNKFASAQIEPILLPADEKFYNICIGALSPLDVVIIPAAADLQNWLDAQPNDIPVETVRAHVKAAAGTISLTAEQRSKCSAAMDAEDAATALALSTLKALAKEYLDKNGQRQLSFAGSFHRDPTTSDYVTFKVLFASNPDANHSRSLNGSIDYNNDRKGPTGTSISRIRNYAAEFALTQAEVWQKGGDLTLAAKVNRDNDAKKIVTLFQAKVDLKVQNSTKLPISLTYANKATTTIEKGFHFSIGFGALMDDFLSKNMK
jgi:hypothetical protein